MSDSITITTEPGTSEDSNGVLCLKTELRNLKIREHVEAIIKLQHRQFTEDNMACGERVRLTKVVVTALYVDLDVPVDRRRHLKKQLCEVANLHETPPPPPAADQESASHE